MDLPALKRLNLSHNLLEGELGVACDIFSDTGIHTPNLKDLDLEYNRLNWTERERESRWRGRR